MKKILAATALAVLSALALPGCAAPTAAPAPSVTAAPLPAPDPAQHASLLAAFKKIDPALGTPGSVEEARHECSLILRGTPEEAQLSTARRMLKGAKKTPAASDEAARKIIGAIKANGFCKTAA